LAGRTTDANSGCVCPPPQNRPRLPGHVKGAYGVARDGASATIDPTDQPSNAAATKGRDQREGRGPDQVKVHATLAMNDTTHNPNSPPAASRSRTIVAGCPWRRRRTSADTQHATITTNAATNTTAATSPAT
jgi:hypothetical protein